MKYISEDDVIKIFREEKQILQSIIRDNPLNKDLPLIMNTIQKRNDMLEFKILLNAK